MTEHTKEATRNRAVLVGLNAHSLSREDNASETSLEELAAQLDVDQAAFLSTMAAYQEAGATGHDEAFDKEIYDPID